MASIRRAFHSAVKLAGIAQCTPHDLRRTCGSWLVRAGVPIRSVSELLRHSDIRVTASIYAHLAPENAGEAVRALEGDGSVLGPVENIVSDKIG